MLHHIIILKFDISLFVCLSAIFSQTNKQIATKLGMNIKMGMERVLMEPEF